MYIELLQLVQYRRLALNNIIDFTITPNKLYQFILGTNGSGKSSVIKELSPLPADPNDFYKNKDGYKLIKISRGNKKYTLKNSYGKKHHHSFIRTIAGIDEELNPGGTVTVQRELVKQEFGIDDEIHNLIIGNEKFHEMSPSRRREWFTKLSPMDYSYAFSLYNHFRTVLRDTTGSLRTAKKQLVEATDKVLSEEALKQLELEVNITVKELNVLMRETSNSNKDPVSLERKQQHLLQQLNQASSQLIRLRLMAPHGTTVYGVGFDTNVKRDEFGDPLVPAITCVEDVNKVIDTLSHKNTQVTTAIELRYKDLETEEKKYNLAKKNGFEGVSEVQNKLNTVAKEILVSEKLLKLNFVYTNPTAALDSLISLESYLLNLSQTLPVNSEGQFSSGMLAQTEEKLLHLKNEEITLQNTVNKLNSDTANAKMLLEQNAVTCPNCNHSWHLNDTKQRIESNEKKLVSITLLIENKVKEIAEETDRLASLNNYATLFREYIRVTRSFAVLNPLWQHIESNDILRNTPSLLSNLISQVLFELQIQIKIDEQKKTITELSDLLAVVTASGDDKILDIKEKVDGIRNTIDNLTHDKYLLNKNLNAYQEYRNQLLEAFKLKDTIAQLISNVETITDDMVEAVRQQTIEHCISQLQSSLAIKQTALDNALMLKNNVTQLEGLIAKYTREEAAGKIILKEMSPTDGLIAKGLFGFVRRYTKQMNNLIRRVWSYPLIVNDCGMAEGNSVELDYYFPLTVQENNNTVADVKLGSTAMREMVNLAFVIEAMRCLGLGDLPLVLDEFGSGFDEKHRDGAANTIKSIMDTQSHAQLFMISHYSTVYGAFTNAEFCVLDKRNITTPANCNQHVKIVQN